MASLRPGKSGWSRRHSSMSYHIPAGSRIDRGPIAAVPVETGRPLFFRKICVLAIDVFINSIYNTIIDKARGTQMTTQKPTETKKPETAEEEHARRIKQGRISFLSAGATRKK